VSSVGTGHGGYAHLIPLQRRYAELASDDTERQRLREQLINGYLPVAEHLAYRFAGRGEPLDDLVQVAAVGLINAVDRFEPARGVHFLSFAVPTITGELRRYFRDHSWSMRVPRRLQDLHIAIKATLAELSRQLGRAPRPSEIADQLGLPTSEVIEGLQATQAYRNSSLDQTLSTGQGNPGQDDPGQGDPVQGNLGQGTATLGECISDLDTELALIEDRETLRPLLAQLPPRDRTIIALRFFRQLTQTQIAEQLGISQMHVSRLLHRSLAFLQQRINSSD
jgi:RNA polymerase sigma-B factor